MAANGYQHWAVVHSITIIQNHRLNAGTLQTAEFFITNVPPDLDYQKVKDTIEQAGYFFGDAGVRWGNYLLYPEDQWIAGWQFEFNDPNRTRVTYDELLEQSRIDKRITLRLAPAIHNYLAYCATAANTSVNQLITEIIGNWQQDRQREQVNHLKLAVRHEVNAYVNALESIASGGGGDIAAHREAVRRSYELYSQTCKQTDVEPDALVHMSIPASLR